MFLKAALISTIPLSVLYLKHRASIRQGYKLPESIIYTDANHILSHVSDNNTMVEKIKVPFLQNIGVLGNNKYLSLYSDILYTKKLDKEMLTELKNNGMDMDIWFLKLVDIAIENDDISILDFVCENIPKIDPVDIGVLPRNLTSEIVNAHAQIVMYNPFVKNLNYENTYETHILHRAILENKPNILMYLLDRRIRPTLEFLKHKHETPMHDDIKDLLSKFLTQDKMRLLESE